jgi:hypothetical protein
MQQNLSFDDFEKSTQHDTFEENKPTTNEQVSKLVKPNLSQSLLKAYVDYFDPNVNACGLQLYRRYFLKEQTPPGEAAKLGIYFEYLATQYMRQGDPIPQPTFVYKGTPKEKMSVDYERATQSVILYNEIMEKHDIEIITTGEYMYHDGCSGISDIRAKWKGEECIIDLKYSALIDDKWNEYGWHTESLVYKSKQLLQPIHYKYLAKHLFGINDIPFYYFIFSSKDPSKAKIIKTNIQEEHINLHEETFVPKMKNYIDFHFNNPQKLEARPSYIKCLECPFNSTCDKKTDVPLIEEIHY